MPSHIMMSTSVSLGSTRSGLCTGCVPPKRATACCAVPTDESVRNAKDVKVGFRWDPGMSRWIKDDKLQGKVNAPVVIQPKSGASYTAWPVMWSDLMEYGLESVSVPKAADLQKEGWALVDVRLVDNFNYSHIQGSMSIPLYRPVQGDSMFDNIKRLAMASFAMKATERDPDFAKKVEDELGKDAKIILVCCPGIYQVCDIGGSLKTTHEVAHKKKDYEVRDPERAFGRESRSYKAAHALIEAGFTNLLHLEGGLQQWRHQGYPCESAV